MSDTAPAKDVTPAAKLGTVRPSQMIHTYGVGSVLELPNFSVVIPGIDGVIQHGDPWDTKKARTVIEEERLLEIVRDPRRLGPTVAALRAPVRLDPPQGRPNDIGKHDWAGTWTLPFPRWMRCPACYRLSRYDDAFDLVHDNTRLPHEARYVHTNCVKVSKPTVTPARFVLACVDGHLDDFPWGPWAHRKTGYTCPVNPNPASNLALLDTGRAQRPTAQKVVCRNDGCGAEAAVQPAFGPDGWQQLPKCGGGRPHLGDRVNCSNDTVAVLVGATNLWFADRETVLSIPHDEVAEVTRVVREHREKFEEGLANGKRDTREKFLAWAQLAIDNDFEGWLEGDEYGPADLWDEFERQEAAIEDDAPLPDVLGPEWIALTQPVQGDHPDFKVEATDRPPDCSAAGFDRTRLLPRLREVSALVGFTRLDAPNDVSKPAPISKSAPRWAPATVARGEGILIRLDEDEVAAWETGAAKTSDRAAQMEAAHDAWRARRALEPSQSPPLRFLLLHTLAHLLINEISHEAGYPAPSLRERIYARPATPDAPAMAGVLIYTAAPDAEGTLGGLVALGRPDRLGAIIDSALHRARFCTSDPFCATHQANGTQDSRIGGDGSLHGAACHVCLFVSETSCEHANRYLDRSFLVDTVDRTAAAAFFT